MWIESWKQSKTPAELDAMLRENGGKIRHARVKKGTAGLQGESGKTYGQLGLYSSPVEKQMLIDDGITVVVEAPKPGPKAERVAARVYEQIVNERNRRLLEPFQMAAIEDGTTDVDFDGGELAFKNLDRYLTRSRAGKPLPAGKYFRDKNNNMQQLSAADLEAIEDTLVTRAEGIWAWSWLKKGEVEAILADLAATTIDNDAAVAALNLVMDGEFPTP